VNWDTEISGCVSEELLGKKIKYTVSEGHEYVVCEHTCRVSVDSPHVGRSKRVDKQDDEYEADSVLIRHRYTNFVKVQLWKCC
jgi:hypothetical protein